MDKRALSIMIKILSDLSVFESEAQRSYIKGWVKSMPHTITTCRNGQDFHRMGVRAAVQPARAPIPNTKRNSEIEDQLLHIRIF